MTTCPACATPAAEGARFCSACGASVVEAGSGMLQRILTFAFVDLVGSTQLAASHGLEEFDAILFRYHRLCNETVMTYGGRIMQFQGDGVLACFGLTEDAGNAALAAVGSMLSLARAVPRVLPGVRVRVGIHSGRVMLRPQPDRALPQMSGLDLNIASRVQTEAPPDGVLVSAETMGFIEPIASLDAEDLGEFNLRGVRDPLRLHLVKDSPFGATAGAEGPLIERETTLDALCAPDAGRKVLLVAAPGLGKSTLLRALTRRLRQNGLGIHLSARLNLRSSPLVPFAERLAEALGYERFPVDPHTTRADLAARVLQVLPSLTEDRISVVADLLGLDAASGLANLYAPAQLRAMRIELVIDLLTGLAGQQPVLLTFDDFHWGDADSKEVIQKLFARDLPPSLRVMVTSRSDSALEALATQHGVEVLYLAPLTEAGASQLIDATAAPLPAGTKARAIELAEGNPLFLRSLVAYFHRAGQAATLPPSIEATLQGVVDSLGQARDLAMTAAVIGRNFTRDELAWLVEDSRGDEAVRLADLVRGGLVEPDGASWRFVHILLQEAAYNMIPDSRRRRLHKRFAEALCARDPVRAAAFPEIAADHAADSGEADLIARTSIAAGVSFLRRAVFDRAVHYLQVADDAVARGTVPDETMRLQTLTLLAAARTQRFGFSHDETRSSYQRLEATARQARPGGMERMLALNGLYAHRVISGDVRGSGTLIAEMARVVDRSDGHQEIIFLVNSCAQAFYSGRFDDCLAAAADLRQVYDADRHSALFLSVGSDPFVSVLTAEANIAGMRGDPTRVRVLTDHALGHVERIGAALQKPWVLIFNAMGLYAAGALAEAQAQCEAGVALADVQGAAFWSLVGRQWLCILAGEDGPATAHGTTLSALIASADAVGIGITRPFLQAALATDRLRANDPQEALALAKAACREAGRTGQRVWAAEIWRRRAQIETALERPASAARSLRISASFALNAGSPAPRLDALAPA
jgi:class 3 adenylate cyclase